MIQNRSTELFEVSEPSSNAFNRESVGCVRPSSVHAVRHFAHSQFSSKYLHV